MKIKKCSKCNKEKTWAGDDINCPFQENDVFNTDNWNCGILSQLRKILNVAKTVPISGISILNTPDITQSLISTEDIDNDYYSLYVMWYKDRGRTNSLLLLSGNNTVQTPSFEQVKNIVNHYEKSIK